MLKLPSRLLALALLLAPLGAFAQVAPSANPPIGTAGAYNSSPPTCTSGQACWLQTDANGKLLVSASVSASVTGFAPGGAFATLTATGSSADVALPAGAVVAVQNTGTTTVSCNLTVGAGSASVSQNLVPASSTVYLTVGSNTHGSCIDQTGSASNLVVFSGGSGIGTGFGGGGGASAITNYALETGGNLASILTAVQSAIPAGTARIGYTSDDPCSQLTKTNLAIATASGTTQLVAPSGSTQVYVCSFSLIAGATAVVNLVGGTGATCTTGTPVAALGSTTAASGMSLAANGGLTFGNGGATVVRTTTAGHGLCLIQSGTTALAGNITYIQQ